MGGKKFLGAGGTALMSVIVLALVMAPAAEAASKYKVLHAFNGSDGAEPFAGLIFDGAGNLYGTTIDGGTGNIGTVFKLTPNTDGSWSESVLHSFNGSDGANPYAGLIFDAAGNLYGTTILGGADDAGTVFKLTRGADGSWTESVLHSFNNSDGAQPNAGLIFDASGNLYGTTYRGDPDNVGTVFKLTPGADGSWSESVLHAFQGSDGAYPVAGLIFDASGNLYSTTQDGGADDAGTVFKLTPGADGSWTESVLHSFNNSDGADPVAGLIFDASGNLYGTTADGGSIACGHGGGCGVAFRLTPHANGSWTSSLIHIFQGKPSDAAASALVLGSAGTLYGTTVRCGSSCQGVVYQVTP